MLFTFWRKLPAAFTLLLFGAAAYWTLSSLVGQLAESYFSYIGLNPIMITLIFTLANLVAIIGNKYVKQVKRWWGWSCWLMVTPLIYAGALLFFISSTAHFVTQWISWGLVLLGLFLGKLLSGVNEGMIDGTITALAPDSFKATTMSTMETIMALGFVIIFPMLGGIQSFLGYSWMFIVLTLLFIGLSRAAWIFKERWLELEQSMKEESVTKV
ncbi:hypothetical protein GCM10011391_10540 [Pullulanibacillus camelliae]|uniref:MFS transporter n=1 Tax=Pullulanibacillus camelliae TaxID=1707096 RepID=A0A8J2YGA4_9BACL|nr:hypothetical protein [Pullulanibacillus camelliae]GGE33725.1 hypothetical protein GCM10011391_10540 [Pullulanibacillus camelliae]